MHAVVSLLDKKHEQTVKELWSDLERLYEIRELAALIPFPHFSCQIAQQYNEKQLLTRLENIAHQTVPFHVMTSGLSMFTGSHPVLFIPVVRTMELSLLHQNLWQELSPLGKGVSLYYSQERWLPHITLAEHDLDQQKVAQIISLLSQRDFFWNIVIDNLAVLWDTGTAQEVRYRFTLQGK